MKITGYRSLKTVHEWGRYTGDANGVMPQHQTPVHVLILETDEGVEGVGLGAHGDIDRLFAAIEGEDPRAVTALYDRMLDWTFKTGHSGSAFGAIGAMDMALWDLKAKLNNEPLWRTLGGRDRFVRGYASGLEIALDDDALVALYERYADRGFAAAKIKGGRTLSRDLVRLEAVRDVLRRNSERPAMMLDVNESWNRSQAIRFLSQVEERIDLTWIEEPVRRWDAAGMRAIRDSVKTGVASGENLTGLEQYRPLLDAEALDIVQVGNVWGITHYLRVAALAHAHDLPVSPVTYNCNPLAHASTALPNHLTSEVQDLEFPVGLRVDQEFADGGIVLGDEPGIGIEVDESRIRVVNAENPAAFLGGPHVRPERAGIRLVEEDDERRHLEPFVAGGIR